MSDTSLDDFLGGRLRLQQPLRGYRAGVDPVFLAASVAAEPGQSVLELGCGVGAALFCLGTRVAGLSLTGVELQPDYAALAQANAARNGLAARIVTADLRDLPADLRAGVHDHVLMNPPYFDRDRGTGSDNPGRDMAMGGATALADWLRIGGKRVRPKGWLTLIQRIERLPEALAALAAHAPHLGSVSVLPLSARPGRAPSLFLMQARHGGRAPFHLSAPLVMHEGADHRVDAEDYTPETREILRNAAYLGIRR